jgi:transcriptional regulator with GAF, ATPase, and Fis domain
LDLSEVQVAMVPGAREAIKRGISLNEAREAFTLTCIDVALEESGQVQAVAARRLGVNPSLINQALSGKVYNLFRRYTPPGKKAPDGK